MYSCPEGNEIAALMVGGEFENNDRRGIIMYNKTKDLQRISETHPSYRPLQCPVLFFCGEDGWDRGLHNLGTPKKQKTCTVTIREFFAYRLQQREDKGTNILEGGKLLQELIVDAYGGIEEQRLRGQAQLRADLYQGLCDALQSGNTNT